MRNYNIYKEQKIHIDEGCVNPESSAPEVVRVCFNRGKKTIDSELLKLDIMFKPKKTDRVSSDIKSLDLPIVNGNKPSQRIIWRDSAEYIFPTDCYNPTEEYTVVIRKNISDEDLTKLFSSVVD